LIILENWSFAKMKAYLVLDLTIHDLAGFRPYIASIPAFINKHAGKYIVQGVQPTIVEGDWRPERVVVIEFPARENAEAFLSDSDCQDLFRVRHETTTSKLVLVDGCS
jgi:uncharacterized protein (DUF1330 family)